VRRFTVTPDRITGGRVTFDRDESHHLTHVLRLRPGDTVIASDGSGRDYTVRLDRLGDSVTGAVLRVAERTAESPLAVTLLQGVAKGDRMERIVRASTELGVARVCPALTERTVVRLEPGRWRERARRWQRVAREATKQCGRSVVPVVEPPRPLGEWLAGLEASDLALCLWEDAEIPLGEVLDAQARRPRSLVLLVGPEGGLAASEVAAARAHGMTVTRLGPRTLRTETAGPAILAVLQARWGDLGVPR
jgi:16S rRNA (uracil1498-N3)-methyltransferase